MKIFVSFIGKRQIGLITILLLSLIINLSYAQSPSTNSGKFLSIQNRKFIDSSGREVILHGLNFVNKNKAEGYMGKTDSSALIEMHKWGVNCIRLGIIWDALEPQPGKINEKYLQALDKRIQWAKENGIYVLLDMHQDLFSNKFADGAPDWATLDEGKAHIHSGPVWSDAEFTSPAVQTATDNFWQNKPAPDSIGVQDHLVNAWEVIAKRYSYEPAVIGYDLLNEPFIGSNIRNVVQVYLKILAPYLSTSSQKKSVSEKEALTEFLSPEGRIKILQLLNDTTLYKKFIDATEPIYGEFETKWLVPFYKKAAHAIRLTDKNHILFLEPGVSANIGVKSELQPLQQPDGMRRSLLAFAPHVYDIVTDTRFAGSASLQRLNIIFRRHYDKQVQLDMPMLVGEWGAFYNADSSVLAPAWFIVQQFEKLQCGDLYWSYYEGLEKASYFPVVSRPYPMEVSGELKNYHFYPSEKKFVMQWQEKKSVTAPTIIYLPLLSKITSIAGIDKKEYELKKLNRESDGGKLMIRPVKNTRNRHIIITWE